MRFVSRNTQSSGRTGVKTRDEIITDMCYTYRNDYRLDKHPDAPSWCAGMTPREREGLWRTMAQISDNTIAPIMEIKK